MNIINSNTDRSEMHYLDALFSLITNKPILPESVIQLLCDDDGKFIVDESVLHDYKDEYPYSSSDKYFGGILRLILAFHNSYGGVIIFGVHDKTREGGKNKVTVDSEKINKKLKELFSQHVEILAVNAVPTKSGSVDLIIVPPRDIMKPPVYAIKNIDIYKKEVVYLRKGAEVLKAKGGDLKFLYGDRLSVMSATDDIDHSVISLLPPSPATIQEFVGRFTTIECVINWITSSRDPRLFLYGQGGSGKSTIAYECATLLSETGGALRNKQGQKLDRIIYISGKAKYLDPLSGNINDTINKDFSSAEDIYRTILKLSNWNSPEKIDALNKDELLDQLEELFDLEAQLIVIDDIDTLTTSKIDAGMEELFVILSRSKMGTKILYTQRGFPSFAHNAAIEVPGLSEDEFDQFVMLCCKKYKVPEPVNEEKEQIRIHSDTRPLAVEVMIGMRRITSNYADTLKRWISNSSEARQYLFNREYQQLSSNDKARYLLAALAIYGTPQSKDALQNVLQFSDEQLEDAIAETRDMFLKVSSGDRLRGDLYSISPATKLFIEENSKQLNLFSIIEAKISHIQADYKQTPPAFIPLIVRARRNLKANEVVEAITLLTKEDLPPSFREHPEVQAILGEAYSLQSPPNVADARKCFESAYSLGHRHFYMYSKWIELEKNNKTEIVNGIGICKKVISTDGFDEKTRAIFHRRLAIFENLRANDIELSAPHKSIELRSDSALNNLKAYLISRESNLNDTQFFKDETAKIFSIVLSRFWKSGDIDAFFDLIEKIVLFDGHIDEFASMVLLHCEEIRFKQVHNYKLITGRLHKLIGLIKKPTNTAFSKESKNLLVTQLHDLIAHLSEV